MFVYLIVLKTCCFLLNIFLIDSYKILYNVVLVVKGVLVNTVITFSMI